MHQDLEVPGLFVLVRDDHGRAQVIPLQGDAVDEVELARPQRLDLIAEGGTAKTKVELDGKVGRGGVVGRLASALSQELPPGGPGEAVLGKLGGGRMVGVGAEDLVLILEVRRDQNKINTEKVG